MVCDGKKFECVPLVKKWTAPECKNERVIGNIQHFGNKCIHNYRSTPGRIMFTVECADGECHVACNTRGQIYRCKGPCGDPARPPSGNSCLRQTCKHYLMRLIEYADKLYSCPQIVSTDGAKDTDYHWHCRQGVWILYNCNTIQFQIVLLSRFRYCVCV